MVGIGDAPTPTASSNASNISACSFIDQNDRASYPGLPPAHKSGQAGARVRSRAGSLEPTADDQDMRPARTYNKLHPRRNCGML